MAGKSVPKAAKAAVVAGTEKSGAACAQRFIDLVRADPTSEHLESWAGFVEHGQFKNKPDELPAFYATLQAAIVATPAKIGGEDPAFLIYNLDELIASMRRLLEEWSEKQNTLFCVASTAETAAKSIDDARGQRHFPRHLRGQVLGGDLRASRLSEEGTEDAESRNRTGTQALQGNA